MQLYLCEKYDKDHKISFPYDSDEYWETVEWLVWMVSLCPKRKPAFSNHTTPPNINKRLTQSFSKTQQSGIGPMQGQAK
jgi:hypothetical protein